MRPEDRIRAQQRMSERLQQQAQRDQDEAASRDLAEWIGAVAARQSLSSPHDIEKVGALPDAQAREYRLVALPMQLSEHRDHGFSQTVGSNRNIVITGPREPIPEEAIESTSVAEARAEALSSRARARRAAGSSRTAGILVGDTSRR